MRRIYCIIIGALFLFCMGKMEINAQSKEPYMSAGYLEEYIKENHIDIYSFKEAEKVQKYINDCSEEPVLIEEIKKLGKQPYYGRTKENSEIVYIGQMKKISQMV